MTLDEAIKYTRELASQYEETAHKYFFDDKICFIANHEARKQTQIVKWLEELRLYRLHYDKAAERIQRKMKESNNYIVINNKRYVSYSELCEILEGKDILKEGE